MSTGISWTDEVWNPTTGCSKVSSGCKNCYAETLAPRLAAMGQKGYTALPWTVGNAAENVHLHPERLEKPLHWKKPRRVFVNSMSDLFHELVPDEFIRDAWRVMRDARQHTFQILTKRPERMAAWLEDNVYGPAEYGDWTLSEMGGGMVKNVWLGTSVENQEAADERIPHLLACPATVRFLSCEPLIGPIDLKKFYPSASDSGFETIALSSTLYGGQRLRLVDWVIVGGESGRGFREMNLDWARSIRDQCRNSDAAFFFKQSSSIRPETGALLDGEEWRQFPKEEAA